MRPPRSAPTGARPRAIARVLSIAPFTRLMMSSTSVRADRVLLAKLRDHAAQHQRNTGQVLSEAVVQVRTDAQLFASGDLEDLAFESAPFGDVGDDREAMRGAVDVRERRDAGGVERRAVAAAALELDRRESRRLADRA